MPIKAEPVARERRNKALLYLLMAVCSQLGKFFYVQGRPDFSSGGCVTYCLVKYQHRYSDFWFVGDFIRKNSNSTRSVHAEEMVLRDIVMTELNENW